MNEHSSPPLELPVQFLNSVLNYTSFDYGIILGSGYGPVIDILPEPLQIPYVDIPGFPKSTVAGHNGILVAGAIGNKRILIMQGRMHYYEGFSFQQLAIPVRILHSLGVRTLLITNAAGTMNPDFAPGELMVIQDHINFSFRNPLIGKNDESFGPRFIDTAGMYDKGLIEKAIIVAKEEQIILHKGTYVFYPGPNYETPAEIEMFRKWGADASGMSTVPEAVVAHHAGMKVFGLSFLANRSAGMNIHPITHEEVLENMNIALPAIKLLLKGLIEDKAR